jgi:hypothetical protein
MHQVFSANSVQHIRKYKSGKKILGENCSTGPKNSGSRKKVEYQVEIGVSKIVRE